MDGKQSKKRTFEVLDEISKKLEMFSPLCYDDDKCIYQNKRNMTTVKCTRCHKVYHCSCLRHQGVIQRVKVSAKDRTVFRCGNPCLPDPK